MFWKRKKRRKAVSENRSAEGLISDENLGKLADSAIESLAGLVRIFGEKSFDIEGIRAEETREACERWARHIMVGSPAHPSHERVEAADDDPTANSEPVPDAPEPDSIQTESSEPESLVPAPSPVEEPAPVSFAPSPTDAEPKSVDADSAELQSVDSKRAPGDPEPQDGEKPPFILRDFPNLLRYIGGHRGREQGYVTGSLSDLRMVIWSMVQGLRGAVTHDRASDQLATEQLRRLGIAVEGRSTEKIRREARECIRLIGSLIKEREARQKKQIEELGQRLTEMRSELEEAWEETTRDALTGLGNRAAFDQQIERVVDVGFLFSERAYLFMIDLDHFKWVNDRYGHPAGDEVLRQIANCLRDTMSRSTDFVSRYGGEEFAVLLRVNRKNLALQLAERVSLAVRDEVIHVDDQEIRVTVSLGIAELEPGEDAETWLKRADAALYAAKDAGRDRYIFASPSAA